MIPFIIGLFVGAAIGVCIMGLMVVSGDEARREEMRRRQTKNTGGEPT